MSQTAKKRRNTKKAPISRNKAQIRKIKKKVKTEVQADSWLNEIVSVCFGILAIFILLSFLSHKFSIADYNANISSRNVMGPIGHLLSTFLDGFFGWCSIAVVLWCIGLCWNFAIADYREEDKDYNKFKFFLGLIGSLLACCIFATILGGAKNGGLLGTSISNVLVRFVNEAGASLIALGLFLLSIGFVLQKRTFEILKSVSTLGIKSIKFIFLYLPVALFIALCSIFSFASKVISAAYYWFVSFFVFEEREEVETIIEEQKTIPKPKNRRNIIKEEKKVEREEIEQVNLIVKRKEKKRKIDSDLLKRAKKFVNQGKKEKQDFSSYQLPEFSFLAEGESFSEGDNDDALRLKSELIEEKLSDFNIKGRVTKVHPGPVVTLFEFEPAPGVKVGKISSLSDDLAMSLRANSIRIIAPLPRKGTVGIEVPNTARDIVRLREVLQSEEFLSSKSILSVPLGKDIYGDPVVADIASMPHMLIAGATGTGKSVCINSILLSLLYRATPEELGLILIDPKILELSIYDGIPHLKVPVVTDPRQAKAVLQWAVIEMDRRYKLMHKHGVRSLDAYNRIAKGDDDESKVSKVVSPEAVVDAGVVELGEKNILEEGPLHKQSSESIGKDSIHGVVEEMEIFSKMVIVIDELADLMLSVGREVESLIARLAQKARAAGIHLIVATQRPSVDVITGLIKANFPSRISFRVSSRIDSRTILDSMGAEKLLGKGDSLYMAPGTVELVRTHGAYVSDAEVNDVVSFIKDQAGPQYDQNIIEACERALEEEASGGAELDSEGFEYDALYDKALEFITSKGQASTSMLQRHFRIGYNRAARIIDSLERDGIISGMDGSKPREVLATSVEVD